MADPATATIEIFRSNGSIRVRATATGASQKKAEDSAARLARAAVEIEEDAIAVDAPRNPKLPLNRR